MNNLIDKILTNSKASNIPSNTSRFWSIHKKEFDTDHLIHYRGHFKSLPACTITYLMRYTIATAHQDVPGDIVMEDSIFELKSHLNFILKAYGNILITGLGLGCVIRGLLTKQSVKHITCIEKSRDVLKLVQPYMPQDRLSIINADALEWTNDNKFNFDFAWHDLWSDMSAGEPHLDIWHTKLIGNCHKKVKNQGAWRYPKVFRKYLDNHNKIKLIH